MTAEQTEHPEESAAASPQPLFNDAEIQQFDSDDEKAGRVIGKMLALFFLYTLVAMSGVAWWTFSGVME